MRKALLFIAFAVVGVWLTVTLAGCAATPYTPPRIDKVHLTVRWSTPAEIAARCPGMVACATRGSIEVPYAVIWAERPAGFEDFRVCTLGHELLHALGANH